MIMTEGEKQIKDYCSHCMEDLRHGDRVILAGNLKFFHFYCYKRKNFLYRAIYSIKSFFIWQEENIVVEELNNTLKKYVESTTEQKKESVKEELGGGDIEIHELQISKVGDFIEKEPSKSETESTADTSFEEGEKPRIDMNEFTENLIQIMDDVGEMKCKINDFAAEKENDEKIIKRLECLLLKYKKENMELRWENNYLREEKLLTISSK